MPSSQTRGNTDLAPLSEAQRGIVNTIREFVRREVNPVAMQMEHDDEYPFELVERMKELGLFGAIIPEEYGGLALDVSTYALIIEEICRGWMSLSGILNSHLIMAYMVTTKGTQEQKNHYLPLMASGEKRGGICITEPNTGSDVQAIETRAVRDGDEYVVNGSKSLITNGRHGNTFALVTKTDINADPPRKGMSIFIVEKGPGFNVVRDIPKLGYKGVDTCELSFEDYRVSGGNLVGGEEGQGFYQILSGLELGRINVAARCLGVARAALEEATKYAQQRKTFGKPIGEHQSIQIMLANMATNVQAAHLMVLHAAEKKDRGERADMEAGMAKLFASEMCMEVTIDAMRIHGGYGYTQDLPVERHFRDAPLMMIGEGTNEIQRVLIARHLLKDFSTGDFLYESGLKL
ncbi:MAG: acyl-CoA dehydrogenase [Chloroflexi bacterium]|jgi:alkylation response protein AidB-like acyl-CoA dehydrogenase|nr:acyl-CoA dehydrogenase [Chloroflexota bacterium]MDP6498281.1 acyl-CoA dehydrogenase family protein [Dehalococcoidia bacterium]MQG54762.1 acyl-CoA dehydrogenase [SAR202 cluster bacterium]|tara:strand:- start:195701 stop:196918 length:1218 start_codon:yes stop_codon:yes gene_type:complete